MFPKIVQTALKTCIPDTSPLWAAHISDEFSVSALAFVFLPYFPLVSLPQIVFNLLTGQVLRESTDNPA